MGHFPLCQHEWDNFLPIVYCRGRGGAIGDHLPRVVCSPLRNEWKKCPAGIRRTGHSLIIQAEHDHAPLRQIDIHFAVGPGLGLVEGVARTVPAAQISVPGTQNLPPGAKLLVGGNAVGVTALYCFGPALPETRDTPYLKKKEPQ